MIRKSSLESLTLPGKLADFSSRNPADCEFTESLVANEHLYIAQSPLCRVGVT